MLSLSNKGYSLSCLPAGEFFINDFWGVRYAPVVE
jgi:hypothetical protein